MCLTVTLKNLKTVDWIIVIAMVIIIYSKCSYTLRVRGETTTTRQCK